MTESKRDQNELTLLSLPGHVFSDVLRHLDRFTDLPSLGQVNRQLRQEVNDFCNLNPLHVLDVAKFNQFCIRRMTEYIYRGSSFRYGPCGVLPNSLSYLLPKLADVQTLQFYDPILQNAVAFERLHHFLYSPIRERIRFNFGLLPNVDTVVLSDLSLISCLYCRLMPEISPRITRLMLPGGVYCRSKYEHFRVKIRSFLTSFGRIEYLWIRLAKPAWTDPYEDKDLIEEYEDFFRRMEMKSMMELTLVCESSSKTWMSFVLKIAIRETPEACRILLRPGKDMKDYVSSCCTFVSLERVIVV